MKLFKFWLFFLAFPLYFCSYLKILSQSFKNTDLVYTLSLFQGLCKHNANPAGRTIVLINSQEKLLKPSMICQSKMLPRINRSIHTSALAVTHNRLKSLSLLDILVAVALLYTIKFKKQFSNLNNRKNEINNLSFKNRQK